MSLDDGRRMRQDEIRGPQASDGGYVVSGIFSILQYILVKSGHAGGHKTSRVGSVPEVEVSFHRETQSVTQRAMTATNIPNVELPPSQEYSNKDLWTRAINVTNLHTHQLTKP